MNIFWNLNTKLKQLQNKRNVIKEKKKTTIKKITE